MTTRKDPKDVVIPRLRNAKRLSPTIWLVEDPSIKHTHPRHGL